MKVNFKHPLYNKYIEKWQKCRDVIIGEESVKEKGSFYLPMLGEQNADEYESYKKRALFYGATGRTLQGLMGIIFRKPINIEADESIKEELKTITYDGRGLESYLSEVVHELLSIGRGCMGIDAPNNENIDSKSKPYLNYYKAENVINWRYIDNKLSVVVIAEEYDEYDGVFEFSNKLQYRVLHLDDAGLFIVSIYRKIENKSGRSDNEWMLTEQIEPKILGKRINYIPFWFLNTDGVTSNIVEPILLPMVNVNLSHYRSSADLEHGRHYTGLPTAWVAGFPEDSVFKIGSSVAWVSESPQANAGFLEFTGQGLGSLERALEQKQSMMAVLGARLLEEQKRVAESADSKKVRSRGDENTLVNIVKSVESALSIILPKYFEWMGKPGVNVRVELNKDFVDASLSSQDLTALMSAYQQGGISWDTLFYNLKKGELIADGITSEEEQSKIDTNMDLVGQ